MICHVRSGTRRKLSLAPFAALLVVAAATLGLASPTSADVPELHDPPNFTDAGAFGYFAGVSLFRGPINKKGPEPLVSLPPAGSSSPVTGSIPKGNAQFGPATLLDSGPITITTSGTPDTTVTSSTDITGGDPALEPGPFLFTKATSTCTGTGSALTGSVTLAGQLAHATDAGGEPTQLTPLPPNPAPNTEDTGEITNVGDKFRIVFNEQVNNGSLLVVNAVHMYLLGDVAVGDLIIGQSRCSTTNVTSSTSGGADPAAGGAGAGGTTAGGSGTGATGTGGTGTGTGMPGTGMNVMPLVVVGLELVGMGSMAVHWSNRRRAWPLR